MPRYEELTAITAKALLGCQAWDMSQTAAVTAAADLGLLKVPELVFFRRCDVGGSGRTFTADQPERGHAWANAPGRIWVSVEQSPTQILRTIAHECAHVAQHQRMTLADGLAMLRSHPGAGVYLEREREAREFERAFMSRIGGEVVSEEYVEHGEAGPDRERWTSFLTACQRMRATLEGQ